MLLGLFRGLLGAFVIVILGHIQFVMATNLNQILIPCQDNFTNSTTGQMALPSSCPVNFLQCGLVKGHIKNYTREILEQKIRYFYQNGLDIDPFASSGNRIVGAVMQTPICNLLEGETTQANSSHNARQPNCGRFKLFTNGGVSYLNGNGTRETGYIWGAYVQAWKCFKQQIDTEIDQGKKIRISGFTAAASDIQQAEENFGKLLQLASQALCNVPSSCQVTTLDQCSIPPSCQNSQNIEQCIAETRGVSQASSGDACFRIGICHFLAAQLNLEGIYKYALYHELASRVSQSWLNNQQKITDAVKNNVEVPCRQQAVQQCRYGGDNSMLTPVADALTDPNCIAEKMNRCYSERYPEQMRRVIEQYYPDSGNCQSSILNNKNEVFASQQSPYFRNPVSSHKSPWENFEFFGFAIGSLIFSRGSKKGLKDSRNKGTHCKNKEKKKQIFISLISLLTLVVSQTSIADTVVDSWSCNQKKGCCIASSTVVAVAGVCAIGTAIVGVWVATAVCTAALVTASVFLGLSVDYCTKDCSDDSSNAQYCTPPGWSTPITDSTLANHCCSSTHPTEMLSPLPEDCPRIFPPLPNPTIVPLMNQALSRNQNEMDQIAKLMSNDMHIDVSRSNTGPAPLPEARPRYNIESTNNGGDPTRITANAGGTIPQGIPSNSLMPNLNSVTSPLGYNNKAGGGGMGSSGGVSADSGKNPGLIDGGNSPSDRQGLSPTNQNSVYSQGGGGAMGENGFSLGRSYNSVVGSGDTPNGHEFGQDGNVINPMLGEDPADYFTRINLESDLFKSIHLRYQSKSLNWTQQSLKQMK